MDGEKSKTRAGTEFKEQEKDGDSKVKSDEEAEKVKEEDEEKKIELSGMGVGNFQEMFMYFIKQQERLEKERKKERERFERKFEERTKKLDELRDEFGKKRAQLYQQKTDELDRYELKCKEENIHYYEEYNKRCEIYDRYFQLTKEIEDEYSDRREKVYEMRFIEEIEDESQTEVEDKDQSDIIEDQREVEEIDDEDQSEVGKEDRSEVKDEAQSEIEDKVRIEVKDEDQSEIEDDKDQNEVEEIEDEVQSVIEDVDQIEVKEIEDKDQGEIEDESQSERVDEDHNEEKVFHQGELKENHQHENEDKHGLEAENKERIVDKKEQHDAEGKNLQWEIRENSYNLEREVHRTDNGCLNNSRRSNYYQTKRKKCQRVRMKSKLRKMKEINGHRPALKAKIELIQQQKGNRSKKDKVKTTCTRGWLKSIFHPKQRKEYKRRRKKLPGHSYPYWDKLAKLKASSALISEKWGSVANLEPSRTFFVIIQVLANDCSRVFYR